MANETQHNVKWLDYAKNLLQVQRSIYLSSAMYDVIIAVGDCRFKAHQLILCASSQFFIDLFQNFPANLTPTTIIIPDVNPHLIESLLVFIYCGEVYIQSTNLPEFLDCCSFFQIKGFIGCNCFVNGVKLEQKKCSLDLAQLLVTNNDDEEELKKNFDIRMGGNIIDGSTENQNMVNIDSNFESSNYCQEIVKLHEPDLEFSEEKIFVVETSNNVDPNDLVEEVHFQFEEQCQLPLSSIEPQSNHPKCDNNTITETTIQYALDELNQGKSLDQISQQYNIPKLSLYRKLRYNSDYRALYRSIRHTVIEDAVKAVTINGLSLQQASSQFAISKTVLWRNLKKTTLYKPEEKIHLHRNAAIAALERGESLTDIAKKYNIPLSTLHRDKVRLYDQGKLPKHCTIRKRDGGPDFQNRLKAAITSCEKGVSQKVASEMHNIPKTTIWRYLRHIKTTCDSSPIEES